MEHHLQMWVYKLSLVSYRYVKFILFSILMYMHQQEILFNLVILEILFHMQIRKKKKKEKNTYNRLIRTYTSIQHISSPEIENQIAFLPL